MHQAFLRAISEALDDDAPRLVYADWLQDNGDADRAHLIRAQCAAERLDEADPRRAALNAESNELLRAHRDRWVAELPRLPGIAWDAPGFFERGFIEDIGPTYAAFESAAEEIRRAIPLRRVRMMSGLNDRTLPEARCLAGLWQLRLCGRVGDRTVRALARCPHLRDLRVLEVQHKGLGPAAARALAGSRPLAGLTQLYLGDNPALGTEGVSALADSVHLTRLTYLDLGGARGGDAGAERLAAWPGLGRLEWLDLGANDLTDTGLVALAGSGRLAGLRLLRLSRNRLTAAGLDALARTPLGDLQELWLDTCPIGDDGLRALAGAPAFRPRKLELWNCGLSDAGVAALLDYGAAQRLTKLHLGANRITDAGAIALANCPALAGLTDLDLGHNTIGEEGARALARSPHLARLRYFSLDVGDYEMFGSPGPHLLRQRYGN
jgi:uncharacterized protein (TIGR02996 family)